MTGEGGSGTVLPPKATAARRSFTRRETIPYGNMAGAVLNVGAVASIGLALVLLALAVTIDVPKTTRGFKGDEATYYSLAHSLARDFDFTFERTDLIRVWEEFPGGPEGIWLKRGKAAACRRRAAFRLCGG